jgi:deazaflavin-dependent oxidoreductase (nitroreductase family)
MKSVLNVVQLPTAKLLLLVKIVGSIQLGTGIILLNTSSAGEMMEPKDQIHDSPTGWVNKHIHEYVESDGRNGHLWRSYPTLLLTTHGRKSGLLRRTALIYGQEGDNYVIVASRGGDPNHPAWYLNLAENPEVEVQVGADKFSAKARIVSGEEKARLWRMMVGVYPPYESYQTKTSREIPVIVLEHSS